MKKNLLKLFLLAAVLIVGAGEMWGAYTRKFQIHVVAVTDDGGDGGNVFAYYTPSDATAPAPTSLDDFSSDYTTSTITVTGTRCTRAKISGFICCKANPGYSFEAWYWNDPTCTILNDDGDVHVYNDYIEGALGDTRIPFSGNSWDPDQNSCSEEYVITIPFYAKFTKDPPPHHYAELQFVKDDDERGAYFTSSGYKYEASVSLDTADYAANVEIEDNEIMCVAARGYRFTGWTVTGNYDYPYAAFDADDADAYIDIVASSTDSENPDVVTAQAGFASISPVTLTLRKLAGRGSVAVSYANYIENANEDGLEWKSANMEAFAAANEEKNYSVYSTDEITMTATPEEGYSFLGWYSVNATTGEKTLVSGEATYAIKINSNKIYYAYFNKEITAADKFMVGYSFCQSLEQALAAVTETDKTIVQINDYTVPAGNYTIPAGVTLLIPYHDGQTVPTVLQRVANASVPSSAYRTLTLANGANINVYGTIEISGCQASGTVNGGGQEAPGRPGGDAYGLMVMNAGSKITLNSGANINAWGYVTGQGEIDARRGAIVREQFEIRDWKSIRNTTVFWHNGNDATYGVLPINQYYIQNVEVPTTYHPGAKLKAMVSINVQYAGIRGVVAMNDVGIIGVKGTDKAIFLMNEEDDSEDTWVRKSYNPTTDQQVYEANNSAYLGSLVLKIELAALGGIGAMVGDVTMDSRDYVLPITNNFKIHLKTGDLHVTQNTVLLPGVVIEVDKQSTLTIDANQTLYLYDTDEWGAYVAGTWNGGDDYTFGYATRVTNRPGNVPTVRNISTQDGLGDAQLIVHGTVDVKGYIRTTDGGASITSTNADAGTVIFSNAAPAVAYQHVDTEFQVNSIVPNFIGAHTVSALLKNETGAAFRETAGTESGISYCYMNGAWRNMEQVDQCFVKDGTTYFAKPQDYVELLSEDEDSNHLFYSSDGSRTFIHAFDLDGNCQWWEVEGVDGHPELFHCKHPENNTYYYYENGDWLEKKFKVSWVNWDGSPVNYTNSEKQQVNYYMVTYGTVPQWLSANPTRANDASHEYSFMGWMPEPAAVTKDVTYMAQYQERDRMYAITFNDESDELIQLLYCKLGDMPACDKYNAEANGKEWKTATGEQPLGAVSKDEVYKLFTKDVTGPFTIRFVNWNGEELQSGSVAKDATPTYNAAANGTPSKPADNSHSYVFVGWTPAIAPATQNMTYTAKYEVEQITGLNVNTASTLTSDMSVPEVRITTTGSLTVTGKVIADNLILEATSDVSGQLDAASEDKLDITNAFFDWKPNGETGTASRTWYAIAVPWEVNAETGIFLKETGRHLVIGQDFDLIYYSGSERASQGNKPSCWKYMQHDANKTMRPGQLYMMYFDPGFKTIRFAKKAGSAVLYTTPINVHEYSAGDDKDANWNGIANPKTYYASLSAGTATYAQVLNNGSLDDYFADPGVVYQTINLASSKFTVGKPLFVQATGNDAVVVTKQTTACIVNAAPRRRAAAAELPKGIDAVYRLAIAGEDQPEADNLFVQVAEDEKADRYTIGQDLVKGGVASGRAQVWVNRYDAKLSVNTQALSEDEATYPLTIQVPANGDYVLSVGANENEDYALYLTRDGEAIWNLSEGAYTANLEKGAHTNYGLRVSARAPQITTGIDEAVVDAKGETRKVLINNTVYIIRGENVYSVDGQLVK